MLILRAFEFYIARVKGGANALSNVERQQMDKEADDAMHSLFIFMEDK